MNLTQEQIQTLTKEKTPAEIKSWVQALAFDRWREALYRGTVEAATGVGKTRIGVLAVAEELEKNPEARVYVLVPTTTLRDHDWPEEFRRWGYGHLLERVKLVCHTSIDKIKEPTGEIDLIVWDEMHNLTTKQFQIFTTHKVYKVLGLTATLPDPKGDESEREKCILIDQVAPSIFKIDMEQAIQLQLIAPFSITILEMDLDDTDKYITGGTKNKPKKVTEWEHYQYLSTQLKRSMFGRNVKFKFVWMQKRMQFLYTLRQKERIAQEIWEPVMQGEDGQPKRTLVFCGGIEQANRLCGENVYHSKVKDTALQLFQAEEISYLGVVDALNEGKNVNRLDQILVIQLNSRERDIIQRIGRTVRFREGHTGKVILLLARNTVDMKWAESALRNFNPERIKRFYVKPAKQPVGAGS